MATVSLPTSLKDVDAGGTFKVAAPGEYTLEVKKAEVKTSSKGNTMINVGMQIVDDEEFTGTYVWETLVMLDSCMFKTKQFLLALGLDTDVSEMDTDEWIGEQLDAVLDVESYTPSNGGDDKDKNVVKNYKFDEEE